MSTCPKVVNKSDASPKPSSATIMRTSHRPFSWMDQLMFLEGLPWAVSFITDVASVSLYPEMAQDVQSKGVFSSQIGAAQGAFVQDRILFITDQRHILGVWSTRCQWFQWWLLLGLRFHDLIHKYERGAGWWKKGTKHYNRTKANVNTPSERFRKQTRAGKVN